MKNVVSTTYTLLGFMIRVIIFLATFSSHCVLAIFSLRKLFLISYVHFICSGAGFEFVIREKFFALFLDSFFVQIGM